MIDAIVSKTQAYKRLEKLLGEHQKDLVDAHQSALSKSRKLSELKYEVDRYRTLVMEQGVKPKPPVVTEITRLRPDVYAELEKKLPAPGAPKDDIHAAYMAGVQHVLRLLRDGYVVSEG
jgi:ADP-heptose:LPS heptosyltransferase